MNRFSALKYVSRLKNEDDVVIFIVSCIVLHNIYNGNGDSIDDFLILNYEYLHSIGDSLHRKTS